MWFTHNNNIVRALSTETITYLSWRRDRCLATFRSLKIDVERLLINPLSFLKLKSVLATSHSSPIRKEYLNPLFTFCPLSGIILNRIHRYFKVVFPVYGSRLTIFRPFVNIEMKQHMFVIKHFWRYWSGINVRNYRHKLILIIWWNFRFDGFVKNDIAQVNIIFCWQTTVLERNVCLYHLS